MTKKLLIILYLILSANKTFAQTNWELLNPKPTPNTGKGVKFVSSTVGYIITANELLETQDAGNSWQKKLAINGGNDIKFLNNIGFIAGDNGSVLKTNDSGNSWTKITTGFNLSFNTVNIIDENIIILSSSNSIVKSIDGGATWVTLSIPNVSVNKTFFTTALTGHAACKNGTMLKTINGGQSWYVTKSTNTFPSNFFTVYFLNENIGFSSQEHNELFKTTDGGETWFEITGLTEAVYDIYFLNENVGFLTGDHGATFRTENGGATWNPVFFQKGYIGGTSMYGIYFENSNIGYITGQRGRIAKTTDGGKTWKENSFTYNDINKIQIFKDGTGYIQVNQNFYKTTDNGNSWLPVGSVKHYQYCSGFYFVNKNTGYSIGGGTIYGDVFKTTDGGLTWNKLNISVDEGLSSVFFTDENTGFISGGYNRTMTLKTTDGGITWNQVANYEFGKIQFTNNQIGYANRIGYSSGYLYKTTDGGNTWNQNIQLPDNDILDFDFVDENTGYFTGDEGIFYKTNDGGNTWKKLKLPYEYYTLIKFYSKNIGYVADEEGILYKTMNGGESWKLLTTQSGTRSLEITSDKIFTSGTNGKIYTSSIEYDDAVLEVLPAIITNSNIVLNGNVTSNKGQITNIHFEYSLDYSFQNIINVIPNKAETNESLNVAAEITNFLPNSTYYFRLKGEYNSQTYTSTILSFTTLPSYSITDIYPSYTTNSAQISATITSNYFDISNIEIQYGLKANALDKKIAATPSLISGKSTQNVIANLANLKPNTTYFSQVKATHQGEEIYGTIQSFTTRPEYTFYLYNPTVQGDKISVSSYITAYSYDISNLVLEYGTLNYEKSIALNPSKITANSSEFVNAEISDLDINSFYYFRLKGTYNGTTIYSNEAVFNMSGKIIMTSGTIDNSNNTGSLNLKGLINSYGNYLTNVQFEYGITDSFGSSIATNPTFVYANGTSVVSSSINNPLPNQTYYYRLVANYNGNKIYSDTFQYKTPALNTDDFSAKENLIVYPNPVVDFLTIKLNNKEKINTIEIYNSNGQQIYFNTKIPSSDTIKIDVSNFSKGLYILKVNFENNSIAYKKLIVN